MNEIVQPIKFNASKLNWDVDISLLQNGDSKYALNVVPGAEEHMGVRSNCLGTTEKTVYVPNASFTEVEVTKSVISSTSVSFTFTISSVVNILEVAVIHNGVLKHIYVSGTGYGTVAAFAAHIITQVSKYYEGEITSTAISGAYDITFYFRISDGDDIEMEVRERTTSTYPTTLTTIGSYYDELTDVTFYWVYDTAGTVYLLQYVNYNDVIINMPISGLNVTNYSYVINPFAIGTEKNRLLYWCYRGATVHKINVYKCLTRDITFTGDSTNIIKPPPFLNATWDQSFYFDTEKNNNFDKYFQLLVRNKYIDKEKSVFNLLTGLMYPYNLGENSIGVNGGSYNNVGYSLTIPSESHNEFSEHEYALRTNDGNWVVIDIDDTIGAPEQEQVVTLADSEVNALFDYVPQSIGSQHLMENNRLIFADCTEGFDNTELDVTLEKYSLATTVSDYVKSYYELPTNVNSTTKRFTITAVQISKCIFIKTTTDEYYIYARDTSKFDSASALIEYFADYINNEIVGVDANITGASNGTTYLEITHGAGYVSSKHITMSGYEKKRVFKDNATHYFGIGYYDQFGRLSGVNISNDSKLHLESNDIYTQFPYIKMSLSNQPPLDAYYYRVFYGLSSLSFYKQIVLKAIDIDVQESVLKIYINRPIVDLLTTNSGYNGSTYVFNKGDRIRLIGYKEDGFSSPYYYTYFTPFTASLDAEILSQDEDAVYINNIITDDVRDELSSYDYFLIEVYSIKDDAPVEYFETEYWGEVSNPGTATRYHNYFYNYDDDYTPVNQSSGVAMSAVMRGFDHAILQTYDFDTGTPVTVLETNESFSNYFDSKTKGVGRVWFHNPDLNKTRRNILRASNVYIPDTNINGLSTFEYANEKQIDDAYGKITDVKLVGNVLKIIQPHKLSSMYLGAEVAVDANGNDVMYSTDKILTSIRYNALKYGSIHPESIVVHNQYVYAYDAINSVVWRDTIGGTYAVSDNGMRSYFKYKTRALVDACGYSFKVYGAYDYQNDMYLMTFTDPTGVVADETIGFHEPTESWISFYSFTPEMYCSINGERLISFNGGKLYVHDSETRNTFYGTAYNSIQWVVGNMYPDEVKKFNSIAVNSNTVWDAANNTDIIVDSDAIEYTDPQNYTRHRGNMQSRLKQGLFRYYNGDFIAGFLRDGTTSSSTFSTEDLQNGRPLIGKTMLVKLNNSSTSAVYLRGVKINSQIVR